MDRAMGSVLHWIALRMPWRLLLLTQFGMWFQGILYRYRCPRPIIDDPTARACVLAGKCGCDNQDRYRAALTGEP